MKIIFADIDPDGNRSHYRLDVLPQKGSRIILQDGLYEVLEAPGIDMTDSEPTAYVVLKKLPKPGTSPLDRWFKDKKFA